MKKLYLLVAAATMFAACDLIDPTEVAVTDVTVTPTELNLEVGQSATLSATVLPEDADDQTVTWSSGNTAIARVDNTGVVVAQTAGTTTITVTTRDGGFTASCTVTVKEEPVVTVPVQSVSVTPETANLNIGETVTLTATVLPANATNKAVSWSSSATTIASVNAAGIVTAVAQGEAIITATTVDGGKTDFCIVTVNAPSGDIPVTGVTLTPGSLTLYSATPSQLTATVLPANATNKAVTWSSSNTGVATVDENGRVTAVYEGSAVITVTTVDGGRTANCNVTVRYFSTDFSADGQLHTLQTSSEGAGPNIILMGDGFSDRLIANGTYEALMVKNMGFFFSEEPFEGLRHLFNVYYIDAVSRNEVYAGSSDTAFDCEFGTGGDTYVGGNNNLIQQYVRNAIPGINMNEAVVLITTNTTTWHGTSHMYYPPTQPISDHGPGLTITYFTKGQGDNELRELLIHENGHGYGKLGDEYFYAGNHPSQADINRHIAMVPYGWSKNTDITGDPALVKWAKFLTDPRYEGQGLGVFLGGETFASGFWRPTNNSIMRYNTGGYNAPSREAIYYRTHKLVYGLDWEYDFEEFVAWDMAHPYLAPEMRGIASRDPGMIVMPHTPPVIIALSADEAFRMGK